ncbi:MAG: aspartate-semialdehyde dehydrogenase [Coriobacteriia bacterium]|nr:aspartate-semialdehyde dehydrogenase [Coriobacteriia bacterium]
MSFHALPQNPVIALAGCTGAVGQEMIKVLEERDFPYSKLKLLASARSAGKTITVKGEAIEVEEMSPSSFDGVDLAFFAAGSEMSLSYKDILREKGVIMIDNSSAFRMHEDVPLIVPEVNPEDVFTHQGIIANPNCSTIQMLVALKPLHDLCPLKRVVVTTYQAASGAGAPAMQELYDQTQDFLDGKELTVKAFSDQIAFNVIPHIDVFLDDGSTKEEWKMIEETKKILHEPDLKVAANCARVPVLRSHSEYINVEFEDEVSFDEVQDALAKAPGIIMMDNPDENLYPMPAFTQGKDEVYIGRLRQDFSVDSGVSFWNVADQIKKGAALNAVQIAEVLLTYEL